MKKQVKILLTMAISVMLIFNFGCNTKVKVQAKLENIFVQGFKDEFKGQPGWVILCGEKFTAENITANDISLTTDAGLEKPEGSTEWKLTVLDENRVKVEFKWPSESPIGKSLSIKFKDVTASQDFHTLEVTEDLAVSGYYSIPDNGEVRIPTATKTIGEDAFFGDENLKTIDLSACVSLQSIGGDAFSACQNLKTIDLSDCTNLQIIGKDAFACMNSLTKIIVSEDNPNYSTENGILFNKDKTSILVYPAGRNSSSYKLPKTIHTIEDSAFYNCDKLETIDLSACTNLESIGGYAFSDCENLEPIDLSGCASLQSLGEDAFYSCGLATIDLSGCTNLQSIGECAFEGCMMLETIDLSGCTNLESIGDDAFNTIINHPKVYVASDAIKEIAKGKGTYDDNIIVGSPTP